MAHVTQTTRAGWRYLPVGAGSGILPDGGFFTTMVDADGGDFSLHAVKNSYDHAACTRPKLPPSQRNVGRENVTFILAPSMQSPSRLACWRSNFEREPPILFEQQPDVQVVGGRFTLPLELGDYYTITTVRSATRGSFAEPVPPSQPSAPLPLTDDFEGTALSQQPRFWSQMMGSWEVHPDGANASNRVLRQMTPGPTVSTWAERPAYPFTPVTMVGMREWQDISIAARFRLTASSGTACLGSRLDWTANVGVVLCIGGDGAAPRPRPGRQHSPHPARRSLERVVRPERGAGPARVWRAQRPACRRHMAPPQLDHPRRPGAGPLRR